MSPRRDFGAGFSCLGAAISDDGAPDVRLESRTRRRKKVLSVGRLVHCIKFAPRWPTRCARPPAQRARRWMFVSGERQIVARPLMFILRERQVVTAARVTLHAALKVRLSERIRASAGVMVRRDRFDRDPGADKSCSLSGERCSTSGASCAGVERRSTTSGCLSSASDRSCAAPDVYPPPPSCGYYALSEILCIAKADSTKCESLAARCVATAHSVAGVRGSNPANGRANG